MEIKEAERVIIAKPVASRPSCTKFTSFSELLAGAIDASPHIVSSETAVAAIRPKTVRFKPMVNRAQALLASSQAEFMGTEICSSSIKVSRSESTGTIIHKPQAKLVSKSIVSLLENMGNFTVSQQPTLPSVEASYECPDQDTCNFRSQDISNLHLSVPASAEEDQRAELPRSAAQNQDEDTKTLVAAANGDRPSYDGYNWRKYGQKQVKGSEYPRSYYKCTHPNCPVKKKVERSFDGQIAEIVYKGEHNHAKPLPPKRNSSGTQGLGFADGTGQDENIPTWSSHLNGGSEVLEGGVENQNETAALPSHSTYHGKATLPYDPAGAVSVQAGAGTSDYSCGLSEECDEAAKGFDREDDPPRSKRRKCESQSKDATVAGEGSSKVPRVVVQNSTDSEILGDGFRWRKYGQKVVKGNTYPRSYYRCTSVKCNVRKYVERASDDPKAFITTYEGKHNHDIPLRSTNPAPSSQPPSSRDHPTQ
ncbi:hypothetical protein Tsubulata_007733 [Turnera subulata]|uniref:WRKY domain-containing protein n=1 Tax=Turnera subulata TaxID=218843 RepID=A0A9Q0F6Y7_9ROSI|nr:hypothetical protein Tsubulata_007733 [Turnera subulata]